MGCGNYSVLQERRNSTLLPQHTGCQWLSPCKAHKKWSQDLEKPLLGTCWGWSVQAGRIRLPSTLWEGHMCGTRCEKRDCHVLGLAVNCSRIKKQKKTLSKTPPPELCITNTPVRAHRMSVCWSKALFYHLMFIKTTDAASSHPLYGSAAPCARDRTVTWRSHLSPSQTSHHGDYSHPQHWEYHVLSCSPQMLS